MSGGGPIEQVLWQGKPSAWAILLRPLGLITSITLIGAMLWWTLAALAPSMDWLFWTITVLATAALAWSALAWSAERFTLTDQRLIWESGILRRMRVEAPLDRLQNTVLLRRIRERLFGLGTIGFATAGTDGYEIVWGMLPRPEQILIQIREATRPDGQQSSVSPPPGANIPVIGLAGGIGAGKSEVARILGGLGCVVLDSDGEARALLDLPWVREELVRWWGDRVLKAAPDADGVRRVDRRQVAAIVFGDPQQRTRLEQLVHPRLKELRARRIGDVRRSANPPRAIVIDAPLLFEAGVDAECDAVIFVEVPEEQRLERLIQTRGWDLGELRRREAAQLPVDEKRRRSGYQVDNQGDRDQLRAQATQVLDAILRAHGGGGESGGVSNP